MKRFFYTFFDIFAILFLVIFSQIIGGIDIPSLMDNHIYTLLKTDFLASIIYGIVFIFGFTQLNKRFYHSTFSSITFPPKFKKKYWWYVIILTAMIGLFTLVQGINIRFPKLNYYEFAQNSISLIFSATLVAPLVEEITFRGVILGQISKRYNQTAGILVSSLLFGLVHLMNGALGFWSGLQLVLSGMLMALVLSLIYVKEQSIWASYLVHASYNFLWSVLPVQNEKTVDWPIQFIFKSKNQFLTGGQYGTDCSLPNILAYLSMIILISFEMYRANKKTDC